MMAKEVRTDTEIREKQTTFARINPKDWFVPPANNSEGALLLSADASHNSAAFSLWSSRVY